MVQSAWENVRNVAFKKSSKIPLNTTHGTEKGQQKIKTIQRRMNLANKLIRGQNALLLIMIILLQRQLLQVAF